MNFIRRGTHFGIISLLTGEGHSLTFEAINDSIVLKIEKDDFEGILKGIPQLSVDLTQSLSKRIRRRGRRTKTIFESMIISIYSPVKGTGSSTYAVNLALHLQAETSKKVILLNIASVSRAAPSEVSGAAPGWKKEATKLNDIVHDYEKIRQAISKEELNIDLLYVSIDPEDKVLVGQISQFVTTLVNDYHYVVVDLPNEMDDVVLKTLTQSDIVQLITLDRQEDLRMVRQVIYKLEEDLKAHFSIEKIQVLLSGRKKFRDLSFEELSQEIDFDVYGELPPIHSLDLNVAVDSQMMSVIIPQKQSEYALAVTKNARKIGNVLVGLVLGGGAALGIAHIGVLRVLEREKIPVDIVVGSSMGALMASLWVTGKNSKELETLAREFQKKTNLLKILDPIFPISGIIGGRAIRKWLRRHLERKTFYSTKIPLKIIAYDLIKRQDLVMNSGSLVDAVQKSIAIPGILRPVMEKDKIIIDGGVLNPLPTNVLTALGIKKIIAVNVLQSPHDVTQGYLAQQEQLKKESRISFAKAPWHYIKFRIGQRINRIFFPNISDIIVSTLQATEYVIAEQSGQNADILIHPDLIGINWYELYRVEELIRRGEEATEKLLPSIRDLIKE